VRVVSICLFLLFLPFSLIFGESYGWPLQQNFGISSTFGDFRDDHFHAGIDLSTNGETGLPVLAIADGKIFRLKVQKRGYGRALYIQHAGGMVSVYAHLESYSTESGIEQIYQAKAVDMGTRYTGDIYLEPPVEVKKGDVVAFSGESGAGLPHLHLELRKSETVALNPLLYGFQDTLDPVPPAFQACYFYPLDAASAVNGNLDTEEIRLKKSDTIYVADQIPVVRGDFLISVSVYDAALRPYRRTPKRITLFIDERKLYTLEFNELSYTQPAPFGLVYDLGKPGPSYYEFPIILKKLVALDNPFLVDAVPFSTKQLAAGTHELEIEASDATGNISIAHIDFVVNQPPSIRVEGISSDPVDLAVTASVSDPNWETTGPQTLAGEVEYSIDEGKTFIPFPVTRLDLQAAEKNARLEYRVPLSQIAGTKVRRILLKARGFDGIEYSPYSIISVTPGPVPQIDSTPSDLQGRLRLSTYSNAIKVIFDSANLVTFPPSLQIGSSASPVPMQARELNSYEAIIPVPKGNSVFTASLSPTLQISQPVYDISAGSAARITAENFELQFEPDSLFWNTFVWTKSLPVYAARYLPLIGPMLQLGPRGVPMKKDAVLKFSYPASVDHPEKLSIYQWDRTTQSWRSLPAPVDRATRTVQTKIEVFDLYGLIYDNVPPVITPIFPKRNSSTKNQTPYLAATVRDTGMDINDEKVTFVVDGVPHGAEYDPDRNLASLKIETPLRKGTHRFWVIAYDYGDNKTESRHVTFRVK